MTADIIVSMRVLFLNQFYPPTVAPTGYLLADLAEALAEMGHEVRVITSAGRYQQEDGAQLPRRETRGGVCILRTWSPGLGKHRMWKRLLDVAAYFWGVLGQVGSGWRPDVVVPMTSPPFLGLVAPVYRARYSSRTLHWCMDAFPEALGSLGYVSRGSLLFRLLSRLQRFLFSRAEAVVALDREMAAVLERDGARDVQIISNWERGENFPEVERPTRYREQLGVSDRFLVLYSGNLGMDHDYLTVLGAARLLDDHPEVLWRFNGGGVGHAGLRQDIADGRLEQRVETRPFVPRGERNLLLRSADLLLVTLRQQIVGTSTPSKVYGMLASGRPILYVGSPRSEIARILERAACGRTYEVGDSEGVAGYVRELIEDPALAARMGRRGREYFLANHEFSVSFARFARLLESL